MNAIAATPMRRATPGDVPRIARLFAEIFAHDPVFDWLVRNGDARELALQRFFGWILESRAVPHGETWITADGLAAAAWIPPNMQETSPRLADDLRMLPVILRLTGLPRLTRGAAMAAAMEDAHPKVPYFYLAFIGVARHVQGNGIGSAMLRATLARADAAGASAYLENSNPRNLKLYERAGFSVTREIRARRDAPPVFAMWRPAKARQGSRTMSQ
jgi:ribosomal protein S18 acetylase RimI-like enzyme